MDKLIDNLGLYDIWTILFPGCFFLIVFKTIYDFMGMLPDMVHDTVSVVEKVFLVCKADIYVPDTVYELLGFLLLSYITGSILHEMSSMFKNKILYKQGCPIDFLLDSQKGIFDERQIHKLMPIYSEIDNNINAIKEKEKAKQESRKLFHEINACLQREKISNQYVKLNIIHNSCVTLSMALIFILCLVVMFEVDFLFQRRFDLVFSTISIVPMLIIGQCVLISRSKKYYKYWVRNIVFAYYEWYKNVFAKELKNF